MSKEGAKTSLLQPEAAKADGDVPEVYRSLNFRSLQDPYSQNRDTMGSRYSTLRAENLETMLNGGLERFYKKYDHLSRKVNIQLPTPESSIYRKTHEVIGKGFNEHQFENAEDFKKAKSVANLARSKQTSEFGLAFVPSTMLLLNRQKLVWLRDPRYCGAS
ncbi:uncharacterized protein KRP23_2863 [Phytophthora ramorum]|uniref:uncharacterized protein n=1 Tax=Phytophthora ramorum TaxID=164328 RepID=UPI003095D8AB|nr:hypothetical protein KRP23_2863 [Phytophthora ramorum]